MTADIAEELSRLIAASEKRRVPVDDLLDGVLSRHPALVGAPELRSVMRTALQDLAAAGQVTLPAAGSATGWDRRAAPALPRWVAKTQRPAPRPPRTAPRVWPHALEEAGRIATRDDEIEILDRIAAWLRDNPDPGMVPVQERSAELFGDEKAIDTYAKGRLFTSGALSLDLLACYQPPLPFASQHVPGRGPTGLLVLENLATYTSFLTALRSMPAADRPDLHIGWGSGNGFVRSVLSVPFLHPEPRTMHYFGDIDVLGLQTAVGAAAAAAEHGLPRLRPAVPCYAYLLARREEWAMPDPSNRGAGTRHDELLRWIPEPHRSAVRDLFARRRRIPQERLGLDALRGDRGFWRALTFDHAS
ncbi:hypothetical protein Acsp04_47290 [Actinomadura sp. NBRC 104425]|uniref:hypothetical protein n=1 Tax=Actinomadura sp. NBRC 104425 TaxID=3032204 RepID=UPI0024A19CFF|nr:hypothetical protein [Actinomadura sp. NBRC 104425]GLZ14494.1 hypothetical protein Acsp04_47290 [Actinomadura sp. NBRC 104425]